MPGFALPEAWTPQTRPALRKALLSWFDHTQRPLPWRANRDPYPIWVSEVMLQQTTVAAVVPYFGRFLKAFPTLADLAAADEQQVLKLWEGLGYYRRARHLHAAAKQLVVEHGGELPDDPAVWADLPGVGRYILGAVLSQAFDRRLPIVEANSQRVLSRWLGYRGDPRAFEGKTWVWDAANAVLPTKRVGDFNQAVMELGALVCTPTAPKCGECPVAKWCEANRLGLQSEIPPPAKRKETIAVREVAVAIRDGRKLLLGRRPTEATRWANMWEVPHGETLPDEADDLAAVRLANDLTGVTVRTGGELLTVRHNVTRWSITMVCMEATRVRGQFRSSFYTTGEWVELAKLDQYPVSAPQRLLMDELAKHGRQLRLF